MVATPALPRFHIRPESGWLNDPNGATFHDGRWHVFFQHNPTAPVHDRIHWGHVSSADLMTWRQHPVAFGPLPGGPDSFGCWSGVFVAGLERPAMAYSGIAEASLQSTICLRWGSPDLETWSDPVVVGLTPTGAGIRVMRDPFVFRWRGNRWALLGAGLTDGTPAVLLFSCNEILAWRFERIWLGHDDALLRTHAAADIWECPQVVWSGDSAVLVLSLQQDEVLGDVVAATGVVTGHAGLPEFTVANVARLDGGPVFYAPHVVDDPAGPIMWGWIRPLPDLVSRQRVSGCLSLPRRISVRDGRVRCEPDPAVWELPMGPPVVVGQGHHVLPAQCVLTTLGGAELVSSGGGCRAGLPRAQEATVWIDADVAEVYASGELPATHRGDGDGWRLRLGPGASATMRTIQLPD